MSGASEETVAESAQATEWFRSLYIMHRPERILALYEGYRDGEISRALLRELLPEIWQDMEFPSQYRGIPEWLIRQTGYLTDTPTLLSGPLTIYRGTGKRSAKGMSWTLDRDVGIWFARRFLGLVRDQGWLVSANIPAEHVLGYFTGRHESEIVPDPRHLSAVTYTRVFAAHREVAA